MSLGADLARALDPVALAEAAGMSPDPWQATALRSTSPRLLLNVHRQGGKSTVSGVLAVHAAVFHPGALVLLLSPSMRQSQELFRKCLSIYRSLGRPVASDGENTTSLALENGSRLVSLPGGETTIRGFSAVSLLLVDEASRVLDETYFSARPMVGVSGGRIVLMSTPSGRRGFFYEAAEQGAGWERIRVPASESPRHTAAFLAEERAAMGDYTYSQEYELAFVDDAAQVFGQEFITAAFSREVTPLWRAQK